MKTIYLQAPDGNVVDLAGSVESALKEECFTNAGVTNNDGRLTIVYKGPDNEHAIAVYERERIQIRNGRGHEIGRCDGQLTYILFNQELMARVDRALYTETIDPD